MCDFTEESNKAVTTAYKMGVEAGRDAERERCAKIAEGHNECPASDASGVFCSAGEAIAAKIRSGQ